MQEELVKLLETEKNAYSLTQLIEKLELNTAKEYEELQKSIKELIKNTTLYETKKQKYILYKNLSGVKVSKISIKEKGYGFLLLENEDDWFIPMTNLNGAQDGDIVMCEIDASDKKNKKEKGNNTTGKVVKIIKQSTKPLIGEVIVEDNIKYVKLPKNLNPILLDENNSHNLVEGHIIEVKIRNEKKKRVATNIRTICHKTDPKSDILEIAANYSFFMDFPKELQPELDKIPETVLDEELKGRKDLTSLPIFTIDGDDTKDIDDAVYAEKLPNGNYRLVVSIADVSHYVKENSSIDNEAFQRGTSCYYADTVLPMLPRKLSNGICSLNPGVKRLSMTSDIVIDKDGNIIDVDIYPSIIKSRIQMTYKKVNNILDKNIIDKDYEPYAETIYTLNEVSTALRKAMVKRGYIDFNLDEAKIIQDELGVAVDVEKRVSGAGEKIIENCMIAANESVATFFENLGIPSIYRIHDVPDPESAAQILPFINLLGHDIKFNVRAISHPSVMQKLMDDIKHLSHFRIIASRALRSMKKAIYSANNIGHYGLGSECYTHFTSPIRRYPDLVVHRLLKKYNFGKNINKGLIQELEEQLEPIAEHTSEREQSSISGEREVFSMKSAEYMQSKIGEEYPAVISGITDFGFFVELDNLIEGLVKIETLKGYFIHVEEQFALVNEKNGKKYQLGDSIDVKVTSANKALAQVDFEVVEKPKNLVKK